MSRKQSPVVVRPQSHASEARKAEQRRHAAMLRKAACEAVAAAVGAVERPADRQAFIAHCAAALRCAAVLHLGACEAGSLFARESGEAFGPLAPRATSALADQVFGAPK